MHQSFKKILAGYQQFKEKYAADDSSTMQQLAKHGQKPEIMVVACSDSRVDPALILQCHPGDLFMVRNVANVVPEFEEGGMHGTSAALEFGVCYLGIKHLIVLGHSQCGGIQALVQKKLHQDDFISTWVSSLDDANTSTDIDTVAKNALVHSYHNCLSFPWIKQRVEQNQLTIHLWFFDIGKADIYSYDFTEKSFGLLSADPIN